MKIILFANTDWYLYNFRLSLALHLRRTGNEVIFVSPVGIYGPRLVAMGFRWVVIRMDRRSLNPFREAYLLYKLHRLVRAEKPDIFHGFTIKCAVYGSIVSRILGIKCVAAIAGLGYSFIADDFQARLLRPIIKGLMRSAFSGENCIIVVQNSDDYRALVDAEVVAPVRICVIPGSGVNLTRFYPQQSGQHKDHKDFRVVLPARILWDKGVAEFVEAARLLRISGKRYTFCLAGLPDNGNPASVPEQAINRWVSEGIVRWLGHVEDMPSLFASADVVVLPSYREGLPKSAIEAGSCGKPLILTDVPGCRDVVSHEVDGLLVPVRDPVAVAAAIERLRDDPVFASRLGEAARRKAMHYFDEKIIISETVNVYRNLCVS